MNARPITTVPMMAPVRRALLPLLFAPCVLAAQATPPAAFPADPRVDAVFADYTRPGSPGCAVGVYRDDRLFYAQGYGLADLERGTPITSRTVFDLGSTSKQFTAAVIVLLAQEGKLSLDDDVRRHLPELPAYERPVTLRQMLHHTSGLRDYIGLLILSGKRFDDVTTADDALRILARQQALNFTPGAEHLYSNSGYFLLSLVVERVTGRSLREEARARIFAPLGMHATQHLGSYDDIIPGRALGYARRGSGYRHDLPRWLQLGDGAVFSTVEDLLRWDRNFHAPTVGGRALVDTMLTRGRLSDGTELDYALGLIHERFRGQPVVSHGGSWGGYRAELLRFPEQHYAVAVLCNLASSDPSALARAVASVHLAERLEPVVTAEAPAATEQDIPSVTVAEGTLRRHAGRYRQTGGPMLLTVAVADGALRMTEPGAYALRATSDTTFAVIDGPTPASLRFEMPAAGGTNSPRLHFQIADRAELAFERIESVTVAAAALSAYSGAYRSDELDGVVWRVAVQDDGLVITYPGSDTLRLRATARDEFAGNGVTLRFVRGTGGVVVAATLDQGRARGIRFERLPSSPQ